MKFKLPKPEDYTETEGFSFKLAAAYANIYGDAISLLVMIHLGLNALKSGDEFDREWAIKNLQKTIDKFEIKEPEKQKS